MSRFRIFILSSFLMGVCSWAFPVSAHAFSSVCQAKLSAMLPGLTAAGVIPVQTPLGVGTETVNGLVSAVVPYITELDDCVAFSIFAGEQMIANAINTNASNIQDNMLADATLVSNVIANAAINKEYGGATASNPSAAVGGAGCQSVDAANHFAEGQLGQQTAKTGMMSAIKQIRTKTQAATQSVAYTNTMDPQSFDAGTLFVGSGTALSTTASGTPSSSGSPPSATDATHYIMNITDPNPVPQPTTTSPNTPAGRALLAKTKVRGARMSLAQETMADAASYNTATYPLGNWLTQSLTSMGAAAVTPNANGLISEHQMLSALVNGRFANPNWYQNIATENSSDLLREIAYENAILLRLSLNNYNGLLRLESIDAANYALRIPR